jgi:hypothetical protein
MRSQAEALHLDVFPASHVRGLHACDVCLYPFMPIVVELWFRRAAPSDHAHCWLLATSDIPRPLAGPLTPMHPLTRVVQTL